MATTGQPLNFNEADPAAPAGSVNVVFNADAPTTPPTAVVRNISASVTFAYDVVIYFPVIQSSAGQEIFRMAFAHTTNYAGNFAGSYGTTKTAATGSTTFIVNKNGSQIGTIVWAGSGATPTFTTTSGAAESFAAGDILTIVGPATADATLANWSVTLAGTRTT
jgi:hypothetical protein